MKILVINPAMGDVKFSCISDSPEAWKKVVGGSFDVVTTHEDLLEEKIMLVVNRDGVLNALPYNENMAPFFYVGTVVMVGVGFVGLTRKQQDFATYWLESLREG